MFRIGCCKLGPAPELLNRRLNMTLQRDLDAVRTGLAAKMPERARLFEDKVQELRRKFPVGQVLMQGATLSDFTLPDAQGRPVSLSERLRGGPVAVVFYRGGWCPYCNLQLRALQAAWEAAGAPAGRLIAISPQTQAASLSTVEANGLGFDVLSDRGNAVAKLFGIAYVVAPEVQAAQTESGKALPAINGDDSWELPLTASYIIAPDRTIAVADIELDYRRRMEPADLLAALRAPQAAATE